jgi:uncharacterized protein
MSTTDTPAAAPKPIRMPPIVTPDAKFFWDACDREEFVGQRFRASGKFYFPPRPMCPETHTLEHDIVPLSGKGTVVSWVMPRHPPPFGFREPPIVAIIALEEGIRFVSNLVGIPLEAVTEGMAVEVDWEPTLNNHKVPVFRPRRDLIPSPPGGGGDRPQCGRGGEGARPSSDLDPSGAGA